MFTPPNPPSRKVLEMPQSEVCPNCGEFVDTLQVATGWCNVCSGSATTNGASSLESYLATNADHLEYYLSQGYTLNQAIDGIRQDTRPTCIVCGKVIARAKRNAIFCRTGIMCRKYSSRYVYLYQRKGLSKAEALALVMDELRS